MRKNHSKVLVPSVGMMYNNIHPYFRAKSSCRDFDRVIRENYRWYYGKYGDFVVYKTIVVYNECLS